MANLEYPTWDLSESPVEHAGPGPIGSLCGRALALFLFTGRTFVSSRAGGQDDSSHTNSLKIDSLPSSRCMSLDRHR